MSKWVHFMLNCIKSKVVQIRTTIKDILRLRIIYETFVCKLFAQLIKMKRVCISANPHPVFVGVIWLEQTTPCTPCKCASQLRHTPIFLTIHRLEQTILPTPWSGCASQLRHTPKITRKINQLFQFCKKHEQLLIFLRICTGR